MKKICFIILLIAAFPVFAQIRNDVVIDEIMSDPSPPAIPNGGLPEFEFIELKNVSAHVYNLNGWTISDNSTIATIRVNYHLQPDSFVLICATNNQARFAAFGPALGIANFPSLDNDGEMLSLRSKEGVQVFAINYQKNWYRNSVKSEGGWSLEMIDPHNACGQDNWQATEAARGGTPGFVNSVNGSNPDTRSPELMHAYAPDPLHIILSFSEPLDSLHAIPAANYLVNDGIGTVKSANPLGPLFLQVALTLVNPLQDSNIYEVITSRITDCSGNEIASQKSARVALSKMAGSLDIAINEVLFNPPLDGFDFVEFYNRSHHTVNLKQLYLASRSLTGNVSTPKQLCVEDRLLFPGDYLLITENILFIKNRFNPKNPGLFLEMDALPSFPDDRGVIMLMTGQGQTVDELAYDQDWHFKLITNREGVSLERIDYDRPTQDRGNWHSAATNVGYGTPGSRNSQFKADAFSSATISIEPEVFSPDNDGRDDFATVHYQFSQPGFLCNIAVYQSNGILVRNLRRNALCGLEGVFRWDGLGEKQAALGIGVYMIITSVFRLDGKTKNFKHAIVLARKLQ